MPITQNNGIPSLITWAASIPAAPPVIAGAPWITKSVDNAKPWPNKLRAIATPIAGSPTSIATGKNIAPTNATAGVGQKNHDNKHITIPTTKNAVVGVFITLEKGFIM